MFAAEAESTHHPTTELVDRVRAMYPADRNPYLVALTNGSMSREEFVRSQRQFCHAVDYFSRPMAVLASRIPTADRRLSILHNVWEEHGEGNLALHHGTTFRAFLRVVTGTAEGAAPEPAVGMFNAALAGICGTEHPVVGIAALGIIERMFADISAVIGTAVVARGWVGRDALVHYTTHETLDVEHADEFFAIARTYWDEDAAVAPAFARGLSLGAYTFDQLYRGM